MYAPLNPAEIGISLPNNQRQHRTLHIQKAHPKVVLDPAPISEPLGPELLYGPLHPEPMCYRGTCPTGVPRTSTTSAAPPVGATRGQPMYAPLNHISQKVSIKSFCKSQFPHKSVNVFFISVMIKVKLTDSWGN